MKRTIPESFSGVALFFLMLGAHGAFANTYDCTTFSIPGGNLSATGLNNNGVIVGTFTPTGSPTRGFIRDAAGNVKMVDYPGASSTALYKINNNGVITGSAQVSGTQVSFTVDLNGNFKQITLPPPYTFALSTSLESTTTASLRRGVSHGQLVHPHPRRNNFAFGRRT